VVYGDMSTVPPTCMCVCVCERERRQEYCTTHMSVYQCPSMPVNPHLSLYLLPHFKRLLGDPPHLWRTPLG